MRKQPFRGYQRPKYHAVLWSSGPIRTEARRLAWAKFCKEYKGDPRHLSPVEKENAITTVLWNSEDIFLKAAKLNLENQRNLGL